MTDKDFLALLGIVGDMVDFVRERACREGLHQRPEDGARLIDLDDRVVALRAKLLADFGSELAERAASARLEFTATKGSA
jgi:hypothetical protein